jgi:hypothetical protein
MHLHEVLHERQANAFTWPDGLLGGARWTGTLPQLFDLFLRHPDAGVLDNEHGFVPTAADADVY